MLLALSICSEDRTWFAQECIHGVVVLSFVASALERVNDFRVGLVDCVVALKVCVVGEASQLTEDSRVGGLSYEELNFDLAINIYSPMEKRRYFTALRVNPSAEVNCADV